MDVLTAYKEFTKSLVDTYNSSPLPACIKEPIIKELYGVVLEAKKQELSQATPQEAKETTDADDQS